MATKKTAGRKKSASGRGKVAKVVREYRQGKLKSGSGKKVKSSKQAVAIGLNEAREAGARIPKKSSARKSSAKKSTAKKTAKKRPSKRSG
jgi:Family of unknown function (DUF6496)